MITQQFTLYLENKPGVLARITRKLAIGKVNIEGISVAAGTQVALIQIVVSNPAATRKILKQAGVPFTTQDVALITLQHAPGALSKVVSRLARAGINIHYVYATGTDQPGAHAYAVISAADLKQVEATLD